MLEGTFRIGRCLRRQNEDLDHVTHKRGLNVSQKLETARLVGGRISAAVAITTAAAFASPLWAQSPDYMMEDCRNNSQIFYQYFDARSETKYEGQRSDGTHAVNGTIYLETRSSDFQCSYNRAGDTLVAFSADGKSWPAFVRGEGSPHMASSGGSSMPPASATAAEVTFPPGSFGTMLEGAIVGRDYFDYSLRANAGQTLFLDLSVDGTNGNGTIYFNVLPPGSTGEAIYNSSIDGNSGVSLTLPESGAYVVRLYLMGNDRDTDKTVGYNLDVSIN